MKTNCNNIESSEFTPLCERCGYPINAIGDADVCPECGEPEKNSHFQSRAGTNWQRRPSFRTWIATNASILRHPATQFRLATIETRRSWLLLGLNLFVAGMLLVAPWTGVPLGDPARGLLHSGWKGDLLFALWTLAQSVGAAIVLGLLTSIEFQGIRFFGKQRDWRITKTVALVVCAHASVGWIVMAALPTIVLAAFATAQRLFGLVANGTVNLGSRFGQVSLNTIATGGGLVAALVIGLLVFESLVYIGVRQCRYANRERPRELKPSIPS